MQSEALTKFYRAYLSWLEKGANRSKYFARDRGLCYSALCYIDHNMSAGPIHVEMKKQFRSAGLDTTYPFNRGYFDEYDLEVETESCHRNPQWVREHATNANSDSPKRDGLPGTNG